MGKIDRDEINRIIENRPKMKINNETEYIIRSIVREIENKWFSSRTVREMYEHEVGIELNVNASILNDFLKEITSDSKIQKPEIDVKRYLSAEMDNYWK